MTGTIILFGSILLFKRSINGAKPTDCCVINYLAYWLDHSSRPGSTFVVGGRPGEYQVITTRPDP